MPPTGKYTLNSVFDIYVEFYHGTLENYYGQNYGLNLGQIERWMSNANLTPQIFTPDDLMVVHRGMERDEYQFKEFLEFFNVLCAIKNGNTKNMKQMLVKAHDPANPLPLTE